ncbi:MAG TPA: hypothetical protein VK579_10980 [Terriglobales bacterium]|jgi:hypothetical protein|nr:hypothetical protein [Terriglobales bacterium]
MTPAFEFALAGLWPGVPIEEPFVPVPDRYASPTAQIDPHELEAQEAVKP